MAFQSFDSECTHEDKWIMAKTQVSGLLVCSPCNKQILFTTIGIIKALKQENIEHDKETANNSHISGSSCCCKRYWKHKVNPLDFKIYFFCTEICR